jgi:hypothetical protein
MELPIPPSDRCIHKLPHPQKVSTQKNWLDSNNDEISIRKKMQPGHCSGKKTTMSIRWTVEGAAAAVASWKMLMRENLEVKSAGIASRY